MEKFLFKGNKFILIAFLAGITIFSVYKYARSIKEKHDLLTQLNQVKEQVTALENEKQNLLQTLEKEKETGRELNEENSKLKKNLKAGARKINKTTATLSEIKSELERINTEIAALKETNKALEEAKNAAEKESDNLRARLSSATELKKAMGELKKQAFKVGVQVIEKNQQRIDQETMGNQGFVIKDGKPTYPPSIKIEVSPAPKEK